VQLPSPILARTSRPSRKWRAGAGKERHLPTPQDKKNQIPKQSNSEGMSVARGNEKQKYETSGLGDNGKNTTAT
jgi:hypothetical protein